MITYNRKKGILEACHLEEFQIVGVIVAMFASALLSLPFAMSEYDTLKGAKSHTKGLRFGGDFFILQNTTDMLEYSQYGKEE